MKNDVVRWNFMNSQQENTNSLFRRRSLITTTKTRTATATKIRATLPPEHAEGIETNEVLVDKTLDEISNNKCDKIRKKLNLQKQIINEVQSIYLVQAKSQTTTKRKTKSRHCLKFKNNECSKQLRTSLESYRRNNGGKSASGSGSGSGCDLSGILKLGLHFVSIVLLCSLNIGFASGKSPINASSILMSHNSVATTSDSNLIVQSSEFDSTSSVKPIEWDGEQQVDDGHYTHTWAVHIPNGDIDGMADNVAREHGFVNHGKIFDDHYHFSHSKIFKRSVEPSLEHHARLSNDERVFWAKQQKAKSRTKRDLLKMWPSRTSQRSLSIVDTMPFMDPKWPQMWYLNRGGGLDMNVIPAWKEGITGKGIVVTILDDGLESDHPDIRDNYDPLASYDVNSHDNDPMPHYDMTDSNRHGTRCAGEVAATANNSICAVGIAYGASVGGVRMLDGDVTDAVEARSLSHNMQHIDIYSASWGPDDDGKTVDGPGELATRAFIEGVTKGRQGKGSIFIWASGNGGREMDNCNCDGYTNSIWTLSISSATEDGHVPWYSEKCSSTLATTYSSGSQNEKQVITTDLHHTCTVSHTGTSASAPLAAGIAALVLESNQNLTWRDLQHIVVRTAKPANLIDPTWTRNGVGRRISHSFGYGLMDAAAMVKMARFWKTVPEQQRCEINAPHVNKVIPPKTYITLQLTVKHCLSVNFLEHVQAKISLTTQRRGDIQLYLKSPAGTKVTLLTLRMHDSSRSGFNQWPFMSVHTWGESPHGNWQLEIHNEGRFMAQISQWDLIFYGTEIPAQPDDPVEVPPKFAPFGNEMENNDIEFESNGQWRNMQQVGESNVISSESKTASCVRFSVDHRCLECPELSYMVDGSCVWECPRNTYPLIQNQNESNSVLNTNLLDDIKIQRTCGKCDVSCLDCIGPLFSQCSSCYPGSQLRTRMNNETYCYTFAERSSGQIKIIENTQIISKIRYLFGNFGNVFTILAIFSVIGIVVYKYFDLKNKRGTYAKVSYELDSELLLENEEEEVFSRSNIKEYKDLEKPNNEIE